ncbi:DUF7948 domain-containing protein [Agrilutibacter solisilvae]|uniref:SBBP repeat-containing protein n=1 Tax=Agrilutibacter solisilvae TaxID=2763317 RepID=A0A975ASW3_9GAMM|nr:SBBP repeat-containing protein [Lysobacter solisilvae]QSX79192.1 SBBP repeat-containing protein [Lysobacter solisilvae]
MSLVHPMWLATPAVACLALAASALSPHAAGGKPVLLPAPVASAVSATLATDARTQLARMPLAFERNVGQTDAQVKYFARGAGYGLFLTPTEAVFSLRAASGPQELADSQADVVRMRLTGARSDARIDGLKPQAGRSHYLQGNEASQWRRDVGHFEQVRYTGVYDGVDLVYYGNQRELEYDFVVAPGADPAQIGLAFQGPRTLRIDAAGNLVLATGVGELVQNKPVAYQEIDGERRPVEASYRLAGDRVTFALGHYDPSHALVIDPVLGYSTFLGGLGDDFAAAIAVDAAGNAYVTGMTASVAFPTATPLQTANGGGADVFVTKFNAAGSALVYSTYLGGGLSEIGYGIAVDGAGSAYITGTTTSTNFPTKTPVQGTLQGTRNMFVTKLSANGAALEYSTYLGSKGEYGLKIAVDASGAAVVGGYGTGTLTFPAGAYQPAFGGGTEPDGILFKLAPAGTSLQWGTYLGGALEDSIEDVKLDAAGNVYFAGHTKSPGLPVRNAIQATHAGNVDAVFGKFSAAGEAQFVSFFGGPGSEGATGVGADSNGNIYIAGHVYGSQLPVLNPVQGVVGLWDGFISKFNATGQALVYSTYFGGSGTEEVAGLGVDGNGNAYVTGRTDSVNFPTASPWQADYRGGNADGFLIGFNPTGNDMVWSSYVGGIREDNLIGMAVTANGTVYAAGRSFGAFPTAAPYQDANKGGRDAVVLRVTGSTPTSVRYRHLDFNDDGRADIFWRNGTTGENQLWNTAHQAVFTPIASRPVAWAVGAAGDFNGDHRADLFWRNASTGANEIWYSARQSHSVVAVAQPGVAWTVVGAGDFNGDGRSDVLWRNTTTGANEYWSNANGAQRVALATVVAQEWRVAGVADFNNDGRADVLWRNSATGGNDLWLSGLVAQRIRLSSVSDQNWIVAGVGDYTGDGRADILWRNGTTGANDLWPSATSSLRQALTRVSNLDWRVVGTGDYNGDGRADILWRNVTTGENIIWNSAVATTQRKPATLADQAWVPLR